MKRRLVPALVLGLISAGAAGCGEESKVQETRTIETPEGSTTVTNETTIDKSGEAPPATPETPGSPGTGGTEIPR